MRRRERYSQERANKLFAMVKFIAEKAQELNLQPSEFIIVVAPFIAVVQKDMVAAGHTQVEFWDMLKGMVEDCPTQLLWK